MSLQRTVKAAWQRLTRWAFRGLLAGLSRVSWQRAGRIGRSLGTLAWRVSGRYRRVADANLRAAFGNELSESARARLVKRVFQSFGTALLEFFKAPSLSPEQVRAAMAADSYAEVDKVLARGKGMILIASHFANWELLARRAALDGYKFSVVARQSQDPEMNKITDGIRANGGYEVLPRGSSPREILRTLRGNGIVAILPDQKSEDVFVPFFGRLAGTVAGPAVLSLKTGAGIVPMFGPRQANGMYQMEIMPEIDTTTTGDADADIHRIMADITRSIEGMVRRYPDQWLWLHDRWRVPAPPDLDPVTGRPRAVEGAHETTPAAF